ncbi:MAG: type II toxin-antitoxin system VapC family toxin [Chloroflexi bacterium]|nr:type II toxin-antitoxin system VapC family toxin [Chloroflexota bacterium]
MQHATNSLPDGSDYVLDSYALLAYLKAEVGGEPVKKLIESAREDKCHLYLCVINLGEVMYIAEREKGASKAEHTLAMIEELPIEIVDADRALTLAAAHLKMDCPIAYADCFAAALSQQKNAILVTGDPEFNKLKPDCNVRIEWLTVS